MSSQVLTYIRIPVCCHILRHHLRLLLTDFPYGWL